MIKIGIIGGSGFDDPRFLDNISEIKKHTPYGDTSDFIITGTCHGRDVVIIPRHGKGHRIQPSLVNFRANVWAMKDLGVTHILATTAVGSLREEIRPGHLVFPDQFIDRTTNRKSTFFEGHEVCHISVADPFCERLRITLAKAARNLDLDYHTKGTVITIEGPRFSTRAESRMYQAWGADVINMSTVPEVVLAREAGICYATIAMSTDYDCWHENECEVTWDMIARVMSRNVENVKKLLFAAIPVVDFEKCACKEAIKTAMV
ncbi:MAG TPA: S-methyl-5'-thioadenosine phosphorylase [Thermodesulfobacteriota bacterium]|nr:S-methyl-5'-thioadenosine phosphorylase [Deltaproteobacteria bacterium]HNR12675.1 S-methyl-5'-thioadenosine phosphorylase [Thermodesulfobacteriota bacterium]HNU71846.1 S-methyl-5'-thioadenosine phosphorylase [Thermodesulfobacteriota bacterium]HOC38874.1 S-methyl-5'-thioadenosine phosphorylase [Thermodesulfobacteriota bacterium]